jgi:cytochrome oxidase Cu insertion factor (SCO1/SenC/PrrC family)
MNLASRGTFVALLIFASVAGVVRAQVALPPNEKATRGKSVPDVTLIGEDSTSFALSTLAGKPVLINPVFTTCQQTCPMITQNLHGALASIGEPGVGYQVLTISFDPADGPAELRAYRHKLDLPPGWKLAVATPENLKALLDAIDFNYEALPEGGFVHANVVTVLSPTLTVSSYLHGVTYDPEQIRNALWHAARESSLIRHYRGYVALAALLALTTTIIVLFSTRKKPAAA